MGAWLLIIIAAVLAWWYLSSQKRPSESVQVWQPEETVTYDDRSDYIEVNMKRLLRELESPQGYWTYANVPVQLDDEIDRLLAIEPNNKFGVALKEKMPKIKRDCATKMVLMRVDDLFERAELAVTVPTKQKNAREAIVAIESALAAGVADPVPLQQKLPSLKHYAAQVEIDGYTEKARRFEFKGNMKKALEYYQDALYSAIHDDVDDADQKSTINELTQKVDELAGLLQAKADEKRPARRRPSAPAD